MSTETKTFTFATDSMSGTVSARSLIEAYEIKRDEITDAMWEDGATLWVEDEETGERITMEPCK